MNSAFNFFNALKKQGEQIKNLVQKSVSNIRKYFFNALPGLLLIINLAAFGKYHAIFGYTNQGRYNLIQVQNIILSALAKIIINLNWMFGFAFLPLIGLFVYYIREKKYIKSLGIITSMIAVDLILSFFNLSGAIGFFINYHLPIQAMLPITLGLSATASTIFLKKQQMMIPIKAKKQKISIQEQPDIAKKSSSLPPISLLNIGPKESIAVNIDAQKKNLMQTLQDFGIQAKIVDAFTGPVVTLYSVELAAGIKSVRLINLDDDIARSMQAFSTRISTIPGKNLMGIEIANKKRQTVYFKEGLQTDTYKNFQGNLPLYLGANIYGEHEVYDLSAMPHLLVAGTTGSGKSVGIHTMLLSMLYKLQPDQMKMILIDPKKLELTPYEEIPHLLLPVVTEAKEAVSALKWAVKEMENRYKNMSKQGVRNITSYNAKANSNDEDEMPFIVVVIDEMADLMLIAGKELEICIQRLAQMGRAAGIHMIMATQRPSVDVITGTIKANFPTRISFKLASKIDSRTILGDMSGAEQLLGQGDMLFLATNGKLMRVHGSFVSEEDVLSVVEFWKQQGKPNYIELQLEGEGGTGRGLDPNEEPYYQEAIALIQSTKKVSTSFLQRNFPIGYNRAAKIIEQMEKDGIISAGDKFGRNREIL